ncbi:cytochrome c oxidase assembly protein subunit 15 [Leucobacter komagatae]|uniref:Cytochrome c oxidase assembly protein subunit 15 n=1 Tax=Leucobacter komagatae TaxID=55969 RepID=A0A542Y2Z9_9MICO|nr:COX15/CtaA family protein [Leucobacter komagatae]TQL42452.1 cytochrome c oxidase assembly protein subunit 15 [Leucobacter komagatae]
MSGATGVTATRPARTQLPRFLPFAAWASFVLNALIIATGGAVRLTGSGLGCTEWPLCTPGSLIPTEELSYHALIEFGNRTISGPLLLAGLAVVILTWRIRAERKDLFVLSWIVLSLVLVQAVVGGVIVWEELAAVLVGFHYTVSLIIVCIAAAYLTRMYEAGGARERAVPKGFAILTHVTTLAMAVVIVLGVITTANGPHSGDENVVRDGFDATLLSHLHAWPGYIAFALVLALVAWAYSKKLRPLPWTIALISMLVVQILVGVYQARNGLPPVFVGIHMVLAALTAATMTVTVLRLKRPVAEGALAE